MAKRKNKKGQKQAFKRPKYKKEQKSVKQSSHNESHASPVTNTVTNARTATEIGTMAEQAQPTLGIKDGKATLVFKATDTLFFRESRPMESMGALQSVFPPSVQTMAGAVRTFIGDSQNINWKDFSDTHELSKIIGYGDDLGALSFQGAWLSCLNKEGQHERLYPAPLQIMKKDKDLYRLNISDKGMHCDLGKNVRLPELADNAKGSKPLENTWLTASGFAAVLQGKTPSLDSIKTAEDLFENEPRLGIARDNTTRAVRDGMLYQTEHIRPKQGLNIELDASGLPDALPTSAIVRLGGEGRSASLTVEQKEQTALKMPEISNTTQGLLLYFLTPLKHKQSGKDWQPLPNFNKQEPDTVDNQTLWTGTLNGIELELHSAVTGKAIRDGGWDLAKHRPRKANSLIPAGSVFFCTAKNGDTEAAMQALHNTHIGDNTEYGLGHIVTGLWLKNR